MDGPMRRGYDQLEASLQAIIPSLGTMPKAILVVSAHWEEAVPHVSTSAAPPMLYDYYGFPEHTYHIRYAAPGSPELAARVQDLLLAGGMDCREDGERGFDHGTFSMMQPIRPEADIPIVQLSVLTSFDAAEHIAMGRILAPLREEGVLVLGSGLSYHNLRAFGAQGRAASHAFDRWLRESLVGFEGNQGARALERWMDAPAAMQAHPRPEHLLPLMVIAGLAGADPCSVLFHQDDFFGGLAVTSLRFG